MRRNLGWAVAAVLLTAGVAPAQDPEPLFTSPPPHITNGTTMVPLRAVFEWLGAKVQWDADDNTVQAWRPDQSLELKVGSTRAEVDDGPGEVEAVRLEQPAELVDGRVFVPLRFVSEAWGVDVRWLPEARQVVLREGTRAASLVVPTPTVERLMALAYPAYRERRPAAERYIYISNEQGIDLQGPLAEALDAGELAIFKVIEVGSRDASLFGFVGPEESYRFRFRRTGDGWRLVGVDEPGWETYP